MNTIDTIILIKASFETMRDKLIKENEDNNTPLNTIKEEFIRLNMIQYRQGAIDTLKSSITLVDNFIKDEENNKWGTVMVEECVDVMNLEIISIWKDIQTNFCKRKS